MKTGVPNPIGTVLIISGVVGLVITMFTRWGQDGGIPAISLFFIIIGLVFYSPTLLMDDTGATSTMRVSMLFIISTFVLLTVKAGWGSNSLKDLVIDQSWILVLSAGLGGKVLQSYTENIPPNTPPHPNPPPPVIPPPPIKP